MAEAKQVERRRPADMKGPVGQRLGRNDGNLPAEARCRFLRRWSAGGPPPIDARPDALEPAPRDIVVDAWARESVPLQPLRIDEHARRELLEQSV